MKSPEKPPFNWRGFVSLVTALSFVAMCLTGIALFFVPPGRIANWTGWTMAGLTKRQWIALHLWLSNLFVAASIAHICLNWKCLVNYCTDKLHRTLALRWEWPLALALCLAVTAATLADVPPFSSLLDWNDRIKHSWDRTGTPAQPPRDAAEYPPEQDHPAVQRAGQMTLREFCDRAGLDLDASIEKLEKAGFSAGENMTLREIADSKLAHPSEVRDIIE